ncbi:GntR family transcriptional regulator [Microbacterium rhizomatis]|uniref:GntR family transcriptional regulator n=1 Tax=Microbacterium rhizomatis TaxID=1631477 RepID=A0A5J5J0Q8_9MICO|nr:GntR family transcriptional regulator [Microbacterium rhizomatis]KAA9105529.1 GntR family transcriptional regulator [Microbacterium rhizomatis]
MNEVTLRLIDQIERQISDEGLRPGERLASERALAEQLGVARTALRLALTELENRGSIRRTMGRSGGIFVADGKIERQLNTTAGVPDMLRQQGRRSTTVVIRVDIGLATPSERRGLALAAGENVVRIVRRRDADGTPWSLDTSVLPARLVPAIGSHALHGSLYALLAEKYGLEPAEADETVDIAAADETTAAHLGIAVGAAVLQVWRTARTDDGTPIEFAHDYFRGDRTRMHLRRYGASWKRVS